MIDLRLYTLYTLVLKRNKTPHQICREWYQSEEIGMTHIGAWNFVMRTQRDYLIRDIAAVATWYPVVPDIPFYSIPAFVLTYLNPIIKMPPWIKFKALVSYWWTNRKIVKLCHRTRNRHII